MRALVRPVSYPRAKHITLWHERAKTARVFRRFRSRNPNQKCPRRVPSERMTKAKVISTPVPVYLYFTNRFQKERNSLGLSGTARPRVALR